MTSEHGESRPGEGAAPNTTAPDTANTTRPDPIMGKTFDPAAVGAYSETDVAVGVLARYSEGTIYERGSHTWLARAEDGSVWRELTHTSLEYARVLANRAGQTAHPGDAKSDDFKQKARANIRKLLTTNAGQGSIGGCIVTNVNDERSRYSTTHDEIEAASERADVLWAGGTAWRLGAQPWGGPTVAPDDAMTKAQPVHIRTAACAPAEIPTPLFDEFMATALPDGELREFAMHALGVAITGHANRVLVVLYGPKGTGKTVLARMLSDVLGNGPTGYSYAAPSSVLSQKADREAEAEMMGRRLVWVDEAIRESFGGTERLKALTGGGTMTTRRNYARPVAWTPHFTLLFTSNEEPQLTDNALRARIRAVPMNGDDEAVKAIMRRIGHLETSKAWAAERPGVLFKFMQAAAGYLMDPSKADNPLAVEAELEAMAREQNPVQAWLDERTMPGGPTQVMDLYDDFRAHAERSGNRQIPGMHKWGRALTEAGYPSEHQRTGKHRALQLKAGRQPAWGSYTTANGVTVHGASGSQTGPNGSHQRVTGPEATSGRDPSAVGGDPSVTHPNNTGSQAKPLVRQGLGVPRDPCDPSISITEEEEEIKRERARKGISSDMGSQGSQGRSAPLGGPPAGSLFAKLTATTNNDEGKN